MTWIIAAVVGLSLLLYVWIERGVLKTRSERVFEILVLSAVVAGTFVFLLK